MSTIISIGSMSLERDVTATDGDGGARGNEPAVGCSGRERHRRPGGRARV